MLNLRRVALVAVCGALVGACAMGASRVLAAEDMGGMKTEMMPKMDIIETAVGPHMEEVTTLVAAVKAAGLVETLKGKGPFTVFAPTNAAFDKLPAGTVDMVLKPENKAT